MEFRFFMRNERISILRHQKLRTFKVQNTYAEEILKPNSNPSNGITEMSQIIRRNSWSSP